MKGNLRTKLEFELQNDINTERDVVYLLVLLRKFMEDHGQKDAFPTLTFYCDWTVHPTLKGPAAQKIVKVFDEFQSYMDGTHTGTVQEKLNLMNSLVATLRLIDLKEDLRKLLASENLPMDLVTDGRWGSFVRYYTRVIEASPLRIADPKKQGTYVDGVVLSVEHTQQNPRPGSEHLGLVFRWTWTNKKDGQSQFTESEF